MSFEYNTQMGGQIGVKFLNGGQIYFIGGQILETFFYNQKLSLFQFNKWLHNSRLILAILIFKLDFSFLKCSTRYSAVK
jgi:hypothetical protein